MNDDVTAGDDSFTIQANLLCNGRWLVFGSWQLGPQFWHHLMYLKGMNQILLQLYLKFVVLISFDSHQQMHLADRHFS